MIKHKKSLYSRIRKHIFSTGESPIHKVSHRMDSQRERRMTSHQNALNKLLHKVERAKRKLKKYNV